MTTLVYAAACLALCAGAVWLRLLPRAREETARLWRALAELRAAGMSEAERERRARQAGLAALAGTSGLMLRLAAVAGIAGLPVGLADALGLAPAGAVAAFALRLEVLAATMLLAAMLALVLRRGRRARS